MNEVNVKDGYVEILLEGKHGTGKKCWVNTDDYMRLKMHKYRWLLTGCEGNYVYAWDSKKKKNIRMHRLILGLKDTSIWGDHKDRTEEGRDNRKSNLRSASPAENNYNRRKNKNSKSKYKGVSPRKGDGKMRCQIRLNRKKTEFKTWDSEEQAAYAYDCAALKIHGKHAKINNVAELLNEEQRHEIEEYVDARLSKLLDKKDRRIDLTNKFTDKQQDDLDIEGMK
ncbi:AP2 domain-containing protein [Halobacillus sp. A5]|uniref:AP2 domain-containing protein n=1 Tax=Halobacillus sp. A5 TaxID=2880263 RepID=UPI0020A6783B|nr:AP2 domain-containing protein [Halobacillus sp. A5]MCP3025402.1 hypothetical protein [Halobacillus sp. A5]